MSRVLSRFTGSQPIIDWHDIQPRDPQPVEARPDDAGFETSPGEDDPSPSESPAETSVEEEGAVAQADPDLPPSDTEEPVAAARGLRTDAGGQLASELLVDAAKHFDRVLLFLDRGDHFECVAAAGNDQALAAQQEGLSLPHDERSMLASARESFRDIYGRLEPLEGTQRLVEALGGDVPEVGLALPLRVDGLASLVLYCDAESVPQHRAVEDLTLRRDNVASRLQLELWRVRSGEVEGRLARLERQLQQRSSERSQIEDSTIGMIHEMPARAGHLKARDLEAASLEVLDLKGPIGSALQCLPS